MFWVYLWRGARPFRSVCSPALIQMTWQGMVSLVSADGMHQLHIFVFFLAVFHVTFSFFTMSLGRAKVWSFLTQFPHPTSVMNKSCNLAVILIFFSTQTRIWKVWEKETCLPTYEFQYGITCSCKLLYSYAKIISFT